MKVITISTEQTALAVMPDGSVLWAPCMEALKLKLAAFDTEPGEWRPEGKAGMKAAVLTALSSNDVPATMRRFCDEYLAAGKPEGAYACWMEISFTGAKGFGPGRDFSVNKPLDYIGPVRVSVMRTLEKVLLNSKHWRAVRDELSRFGKEKSPEDLLAAFIAGENASWDEKDADDALRAALANPSLK